MRCAGIAVAAVIAVIAVTAARPAQAQPSTAQAEVLFRQGQELMSMGRIAEACPVFDASQKLDPTIATLLNQASCQEKNGQLTTAWGLFLLAERQARDATDAATRQLHQVATLHAARLEPRLSTLTITVPPESRVDGLEILQNTAVVQPGAWNKALPVDGGTYKITARAPNSAEWTAEVTIGPERDTQVIAIPRLKAAALASQLDLQISVASQVTAPQPASQLRLVPVVLGAGALVLGGVALGFELSARSTRNDVQSAMDTGPGWNSFHDKRHAAQGFGTVALACAGVAVWLGLRNGSESALPTQPDQLDLLPIFSTDQAGLVLQGSY